MRRLLSSVHGNHQRLDGGAMYGNAPRPVWERWSPPDARHRIELACRCLLVEEEGEGAPPRRVLFEAGIGAFFAPELRDRYGVAEPQHVLIESLAGLGLGDEDIDVVVLSHLHFDHAGGLLQPWAEGAAPALLFPRARFVVGAAAWERARRPHPRDRASFVPALNELLAASGRLEVVEGERSLTLGPDYRLHRSDGHTPGLVCAEIPGEHGPVVFVADLVPGRPWVHLPITMGYDRFPERLIDEKAALFADLLGRGARLFFTHDPEVAMGRLVRDEGGRYGVGEAQAELRRVPA